MKKAGKIIAYSIAISFVLLVAFICIVSHLMGYNVADYRKKEIVNREKIIERIDSFQNINNRLPETLSSIGFSQTSWGYEYRGICFDYIMLSDSEYIIEYTSVDGVLTQYVNTEHRWMEDPHIYLIELPVNADTIAAINRISNFEPGYNIPPQIDSISYNHLHVSPISDIAGMPDSVAYIRYLYVDGSPRCEGWIAFFDDPENDFSHEFGEWKYYDGQGNSYRKFWNYKENGKLIYEAD